MDMKAYKLRQTDKAICKERGYVLVEDKEGWEEDVWNLLNWSCWNYDDHGNAIKPEVVHSPLDHCNSDIILQIDGTDEYRAAQFCGFESFRSLETAVKNLKSPHHDLWPLAEAPREYSYLKSDGQTVWGSNDGKNWITL